MAEKAVAVLCILVLGLFCSLADYASARGGPLVEDTSSGSALDTTTSTSDVVLGDNSVAEVSVVLINGDGEDPAEVYGVITARIGDSPNEIVLFQKSARDYVSVRPGHLIPLARSVVNGVPLDSHLTIRADLWDYDSTSKDDEIANGSAHFPTKSSGNSNNSIKGRYGEIQVNIIWHSAAAVVDDSKISEATADH